MERVKREQGRDKRAGPQAACHPLQRQEEKERARRVDPDAREMMPAGIHPVELDVEHVGDPRQRMPVRRISACQRPEEGVGSDPVTDMGIVGHIVRVVVGEELMAPNLPEDCENRDHEKEAHREIEAPRGYHARRRFPFLLLFLHLTRSVRYFWACPALSSARYASSTL